MLLTSLVLIALLMPAPSPEALAGGAPSVPSENSLVGVTSPGNVGASAGLNELRGKTVLLTERDGLTVECVVVEILPDGIVVDDHASRRVVPLDRIGYIEQRGGVGVRPWLAAWITAAFVTLPAAASCSPNCDSLPAAAGISAAIGFGAGALHDHFTHRRLRYGVRPASPHAIRQPAPVTSPNDLWMRVREGDRLDVRLRDGTHLSGHLVMLSEGAISVRTATGMRTITAKDVRRIERRGDQRWGAALIGLGVGLAAGLTGDYDNAAAGLALAPPLAMAPMMLIGTFLPKTTAVFDSTPQPVRTRTATTFEARPGSIALNVTVDFR